MRDLQWVFGIATCGLAACGSSHGGTTGGLPDAAAVIDAAIDAPASCPKTLLVGGMDVVAQGWTPITIQPATITYGADYTQLTTSTPAKASAGGQLLLTRPATVAVDAPFKLQVVMRVVSVDLHGADSLDAAAAILGSLHGTVGDQTDRSEMAYIDPAKIAWADDSKSTPANGVNGDFHTYELSVAADRMATFSVDGAASITRTGFVTNGTIAVGDQTNDPNYDATTQIRSVTLLCAD